MPGSDFDDDLVREGIQRYRAKEYERARDFFERALTVADDVHTRAEANFYLSKLIEDPIRKRQYLEDALANDLTHAEARRDLAILDGRLKPDAIIDPDKIPALSNITQSVLADRFTCPKCGGRMVYSPNGALLVCEYCNRSQAIAIEPASGGEDFFVAMADGTGFRKTISVKTFQCQGCGASFLLPPGELSATCAYCGSIHVITLHGEHQLIEPDAIIPMAFDQRQASDRLIRWIEENKVEPQVKIIPPRGLYLPVWTFDLLGNVSWKGRIIRNKQEVPVSGEYPAQFSDIPIPGSKKLSDIEEDFLDKYQMSDAPAYDPRFLAGWPAGMCDLPLSEAALLARQAVVTRFRQEVRSKVGNVIDLNYSSANIAVTSYRLFLLPAWLTNYCIGEKIYRVVINGQNGAVTGEIPDHGSKSRLKNWLGSSFRKR
jgi:hypothetical protein